MDKWTHKWQAHSNASLQIVLMLKLLHINCLVQEYGLLSD